MTKKESLKEKIKKLEKENKNIYERLGEIAESIFQLRNGDVWKLKQDVKKSQKTVKKLQRQVNWCMENKKCGKHITAKQLEFMIKEFLGGQECTTDVTSFKAYSIEEYGLFFETEDGSRFAITIEKEI